MGRILTVSDLHGMLPLWQQIKDFLQPDDQLIVLGDCADRGRDGWQIIKDCLTDERITYIRGNHEDLLLKAWRTEFTGEEFYLWMCNGGGTTYEALMAEEKPDMWLHELNYQTKYFAVYENERGDIIHLTHAGFTPVDSDFYPSKYDLIWDREHLEDYPCSWWDKENPKDIVVHGHTPLPSLARRLGAPTFEWGAFWYASNHKVDIDNGCCDTGVACLFDLDTFDEHIFVGEINEKDYI